jgi:beta-glucosidase
MKNPFTEGNELMIGTWHCFLNTPFFNGKFIFLIAHEHGYQLSIETEPVSRTYHFTNILVEGSRLAGEATSGFAAENDLAIVMEFDEESFLGKLTFPFLGEIPLQGARGRGGIYVDPLIEQVALYRKGVVPVRTQGEIQSLVEDLLKKMPLEQKVGQLSQCLASDFSFGGEKETMPPEEQVAKGLAGEILGAFDVHRTFALQKIAVEESPLRIPLLFHADILHGYQTIFPVPLGWSCSWDLEQIRRACVITAKEAAISGIFVNHGPMVDIARDPRWGRVVEGAGEDPYLGAQITRAQVEGYQGNDLASDETIAACLKHFAAYGAAEGGRDYNTVDISPSTLHNVYLPPFEAGVDAGAKLVMNAFNIYLGVPAAGNKALLRDILRRELNFKGVIISDYGSIEEIVVHGCAENLRDAARMAIEATLDIEMVSQSYLKNLPGLVRDGVVPESLIDDAVRRIMALKFELGVMDDPFRYIHPEKESRLHFCQEHLTESLKLAQESIVLLKNDGVLPVKKTTGKIALIGPFAESKDLLGPWQFSRYGEHTVTLAEGIRSKLPDESQLLVAQGCQVSALLDGGIKEALRVANSADLVLLALGESSEMSGEAASRMDITLPESQRELAQAISQLGKPAVLILVNGRPLDIKWFDEHVNAVVETWFLGSMAGQAVADVLFGDINPSGRLTISFPVSCGQIPVYYNSFNTGRPKHVGYKFISQYLDGPNEPLYPFGYGLSYTQFVYSNVSLSNHILKYNESLTASVRVKNTGSMSGVETVQLYIRDVVGSVVRPVKELKGFDRVFLKPGESREVVFNISEKDLAFYHVDGTCRAEAGEFVVFIGSDSKTNNQATFSLVTS